MTSNRSSTLTNLTRNFDAGECKLIFDNQHNGTKDNKNKNKNAVMLDERKAAYRSGDASNPFNDFYDYHDHYSIHFYNASS